MHPTTTRRGTALLLALAVVLVQGLVLREAARPPAIDGGVEAPARLAISFVHVLTPQAPTSAPRSPAASARTVAVADVASPAMAASAAEDMRAPPHDAAPELASRPADAAHAEASLSRPAAEPTAAPPDPTAPPRAESAAPTPAAQADAPEADGFDWPPSTRLRYALTGHYRGPLEGSAQVEWLRDGAMYQVHLDVVVGLRVAPLLTRTMSSHGQVGVRGLAPRHYTERTQLAFGVPHQVRIRFGRERIELPGRRLAPRPGDVQDAVSQFVQLVWRLRTDPELAAPGQVLVLMLALADGVSPWIYDVGPAGTLWTRMGPLDVLPLVPRREPRAGGPLVPTIWIAPGLQHLPVRIMIRQDAETYLDLVLDALPLQAAVPTE